MSRHSYIPLDEAKQITGRSDTTLLRWHRAGHVRRRMVRGRPYYHGFDLHQHLAMLAAKEAEANAIGPQGDQFVAAPNQAVVTGANSADHTNAANLSTMFIDQITELRAENDRLRQRLHDSTETQAILIRERARLQVDLRLAQAAQAEAESQHARDIPAFAELQLLLNRTSSELVKIQQRRDQVAAQLQATQQQYAILQQQNQPLQQAVTELESVKATLLSNLHQATTQIAEQQRQLQMLKRDKDMLNADLIWLDDLIKAMFADPLLAVRKNEYQRRYDQGRL
jgi:hypothetical protein